jgi:HD-like signal output (HDOD) protein
LVNRANWGRWARFHQSLSAISTYFLTIAKIPSAGIIIRTMTNPARFLQSVTLPVMPEVAQALIRTLNNDDADVPMVTAIIAKDPGLTTTLLRMANSAMFGMSRSVHTLESAVSVIGMAHIRARALSICLASSFVFPPGLDRMDFWRNSMVCAGYAKWLASLLAMDEQEAWLTGMMLRLGEIVIAQRLPDALVQIEAQPCAPGERWKREREAAGFDEGQIAAEIARRWDFPETVAIALECTALPLSSTAPRLAAVINLAALITDQVAVGALALRDLPVSVMQASGLNVEQLQFHTPHAESFSDISMLQG